MTWILLIVVVLLAVIVLGAIKGRTGRGGFGTIGFPYQRRKTLFSAAERSFLGVLDQAVGPEHRVFGKVRVADVAAVMPGLGNSAYTSALNRIAFKHFDFVVCRASDLAVVCAVELNDKSHAGRRVQTRDALLVDVCRAIDLPLLTVPAKAAYAPQDVRTQFIAAMESDTVVSNAVGS